MSGIGLQGGRKPAPERKDGYGLVQATYRQQGERRCCHDDVVPRRHGGDHGANGDTADFSASATAVNANLATGNASGQGLDTLATFENLIGSAFGDTLTGDASVNTITPGLGDDAVSGGGASDWVDYSDAPAAVTVDFAAGKATGGSGNDTLTSMENAIGSEFDDMFVDDNESSNGVLAGGGNDTFDQGADPSTGNGDSDDLDGEGGTDLVDYGARTRALTVTLNSDIAGAVASGGCGGDRTLAACADGDQGRGEDDDIQGVENVNLGSSDDSFVGSAFNNIVNPGGGQNVLDGLGGSDTLDYSTYTAGVEVNMAGGSTAGDSAVNFENVRGSGFADSITGNELSNNLRGRGGNDNVRGGSGDDTIRGGAGNDVLRGGSGDDDIFGGKGNDALRGGGGDDLCKGGPGKDTAKGCELGKA